MIKIYGSEMCPDCIACKLNFDTYKIEYAFIDINKSLHDLSEFLVMRDSLPVFDHCKEIHDIGLPALLLDDDTVTLNWESIVKELGHEVIEVENSQACSLDRKGC